MNVLFLASQAPTLSPDTAGSLPRALADLGHEVRVVVPLRRGRGRGLTAPVDAVRFHVPHVSGAQVARVSQVDDGGVTYYLIAGPPVARAARAGSGHADEACQFIFTSLAALGLCRALDWTPDIVHGLDNLAGPAIFWLATEGLHAEQFPHTASLLTIQNLPAAPNPAGRCLLDYGLAPSDAPGLPDWARDTLLGLGLAHADVLSAHSPTAAREMLMPEHGHGWEGALQARAGRLSGILDGIDLDRWNPSRDKHLTRRYDADTLEKRATNKRALQKALGLPTQPRTMLIGLVLPPDASSALEVCLAALRELLAAETVQIVWLGTAPLAYKSDLTRLTHDYPGRVALHADSDGAFARQLYGAADLLLVPRAEPGGANAMIALRYGAVPVVQAAGSLTDTVFDYAEGRQSTGFAFKDYNAPALLAALRRALRVYRQPARWQALQRRGMRQALKFTWARSAQAHLALYAQALTLRKEAVTTLTQRLADASAAPAAGPDGGVPAGAGQALQR